MKTCAVHGCGRPVKGRGYCCGHYQRVMRHGSLNIEEPITHRRSGPANFNWKGGHEKDGRVYVRVPNHPHADKTNGYVKRARLVVEQVCGRVLTPSEVVHHKNGIKSDDRPENLTVMSQSDHAKIHFSGSRFVSVPEGRAA